MQRALNMASSKVYVGGLPWTCKADDLKQVCSKFGFVVDAFIVMDRTSATPRSKGFGFVTFSHASDAATCLRSLNGSEYGGRVLKVGMAHRETGGIQGFQNGENQTYSPLGDTGMRSRNASSHSSGFVSGDMYGQQSYEGVYGSNYNMGNNMYGFGGIGTGFSAAPTGTYDQARSSYNVDAGANRAGRQYGGYDAYGNNYTSGFGNGNGNF